MSGTVRRLRAPGAAGASEMGHRRAPMLLTHRVGTRLKLLPCGHQGHVARTASLGGSGGAQADCGSAMGAALSYGLEHSGTEW